MKLSDENQCLVLTKLLVEAGCRPCELGGDDKPPIYGAVIRGFVSVVECLLSRGARLPPRILFEVLRAPVVKRVEMIQLLIDNKANVHALNHDGDGLLHVTMRSPDRDVLLEIAKRLIEVGCKPLARNIRGETPIHIAINQCHYEVINYLISFTSSSDVSFLLQDPATAASIFRFLHCNATSSSFHPEQEEKISRAIEKLTDHEGSCLELAKSFITYTSQVDASGSGGLKLMEIAARNGFSDVVNFLFRVVPLPLTALSTALLYRAKANIGIRHNGDTLIHIALSKLQESECLPITRTLIEAGRDPFASNSANEQPIHIAASRGLLSVVKYLLAHATNTSVLLPIDLLSTPLQSRSRLVIFRLLVDHFISNSSYAFTDDRLLHVLKSTDEGRYLQTMTTLWAARDSVALNAAFHIAITRGFTSVVDYLSRHVPLPSRILFFALDSLREEAIHKQISMINSLVRNGANVHVQDFDQDTVLNRALREFPESPCLELTKIFVEAGSSVSARDAHGKLPTEAALTRKFPSVMEYLLLRNAPLHSAILLRALKNPDVSCEQVLRMVSWLFQHRPDVLRATTSGETALHIVLGGSGRQWTRENRLEIVDVLVRAGCNTNARDPTGRTPLELATRGGHFKVATYLEQHRSAVPTTPPSSGQGRATAHRQMGLIQRTADRARRHFTNSTKQSLPLSPRASTALDHDLYALFNIP